MANELCELACAPTPAHLHTPPAREGLESHEEVGHAPPLVLVVAALGTARSETQRLVDLGEELAGTFVEAHHGALLVVGLLVEVQHLLHPPHEPGALFGRDHPALDQVGTQFVFLSLFLTVSWETLPTMPISTALSAKSLMLQRSCPSGACEQASAIRRASALPSKDLS